MSVTALIIGGWLVMALLMAMLWLVQLRTRVAGTVDIAWSVGTGLLAVAFCSSLEQGDAGRRWLVGTLALIWGSRLALHLVERLRRETEDSRYAYMRATLGKRVQPVMFLFFQIQAIWALMFALPLAAAARSTEPFPAWHDWMGIGLWLLALTGETVADRQLSRFRADPANRGSVCDIGLWRYSRHPNYFFEWLHWWAYLFLAWNSAWWWMALAGIVVMYVFLNYVTGIPYTEKQAVRSRGEAYRRYQDTTSAFFPFPPKRTKVPT
jgi:steroid 5-alpha reductase family enzyme